MACSVDTVAELIKSVADPTRLGILMLLARRGEVCVCEMAGLLDVPDFKISRHLSILRKSGLVKYRREGVWMHYSLAEQEDTVREALQQLVHVAAKTIEIKTDGKSKSCCKTKEVTS